MEGCNDNSLCIDHDLIHKMLPVFKRYPVKRAALFGSYVRGVNTDKSDIDIVADLGINDVYNTIDYIYVLWDDLENTLGINVDLITLDGLYFRPEYKTTKNIINNMRWFYEV